MKVWIAVLIVSWAYWISIVEPSCCIAVTENEQKLKIYTVRFTTERATRNSYLMFMKDLYNALTERADRSGDIPILPPRSAQPTDPRQYVLVELSNGYQTVTLALNVSNVYILGYHASAGSYFFSDVPNDVRNALFPGSSGLPFTGRYGALEGAAGVGDRREIPLGMNELRQHIDNLNCINPNNNRAPIARALIVCIQMVSEAARMRNIQQQILAVAEPHADGTYGTFNPDGLMTEYETSWEDISSAIQSATDGIFASAVRLVYDAQELVLSTLRQVIFIIALMPMECNPRPNLQFLRMSTSTSSLRSSGLVDNSDTCEKVLAPTSHITGQNGFCVDVYEGIYHDGNKVILWECGQNQANQLWTLTSNDNTIRSGGKCLTTYGYSSQNYVMIYDCDTAVPDATKWEIRSDGTIRNPRSGLVLTGSRDSSGMINLVVDHKFDASRQTFYASNNTKPAVTTIVGYKGMCLLASGSRVWLEDCVSNDAKQQWAIYPDGTIRPQKNRNGCLKYANDYSGLVNVATCDGFVEERWVFRNDGTILHKMTEMVMDVHDPTATLLEVSVNHYSNQQFSQIWFQVQP
ncbi:hypothetical protein ES332_A13G089700v1 [Gossypium tomentosum]|nr:hypothetical protein ES332_A13G089700v1 [Gossypium tomentosum]